MHFHEQMGPATRSELDVTVRDFPSPETDASGTVLASLALQSHVIHFEVPLTIKTNWRYFTVLHQTVRMYSQLMKFQMST